MIDTKRTAFICDESYFWHDTGSSALFLPPGKYLQPDGTAESPESKRRVKNLLERSGFIRLLAQVSPRAATRAEVESFHSAAYIDRIQRLSEEGGGDAGGFTPFGGGSYEIALLSAGGAITAVEAVMKGNARNAYVLTRPPGHHAQADSGAGYCIFNNVVIAAHYARKEYGLKRIMILDWDVHHGNGTEDAFYSDPDTLFVSIHQETNFPTDRGFLQHTGMGEGIGYTINLPLPPATSNAGYMYAFEKLIIPVAEQFQPELIIISAGQDANAYDPLARMMLTAECYRQMTHIIKKVADRCCQGRLIACHEGGYSTAYVPFCTLRIIEELRGLDSGVEDPFMISLGQMPVIEQLLLHQKQRIDEAAAIHADYWKLS